MTVAQPRPRLRKPLDASPFQPEIGSFRLHLAAEGKAAKTVRIYTEAVQWFAAAQLVPEVFRTRWEQVDRQDVQRWMVWLLGRYSDEYVSNQYRALQQFFKWWAEEEQLPDPMARMRPPKVVNGHWEIRLGGLVFSGLAATSFPGWWPRPPGGRG